MRAQQSSADGSVVALLDESDCGALTDYESEVALVRARPRLGVRAFGRSRTNLLTLAGRSTHIKMHWQGGSTLVIECVECEGLEYRIWRRELGDIAIEFHDFPPDRDRNVDTTDNGESRGSLAP